MRVPRCLIAAALVAALCALSTAAATTAKHASSSSHYYSSTTTNTTVPAKEREALVDLYLSCGGKLWVHQSNWLKGDPCLNEWFGITCEIINGTMHVWGIEMNPVGTLNILTGKIPPSLGNLTQLRKLYLSSAFVSSELTGELPDTLQNLKELRCLYASHGSLTGPIPAWLATMPNLQGIMLRRNKFMGPFPDLSSLTDLRHLWFDEQEVSGTLASLAKLERLTTLMGYNNKLTGPLPTNLCDVHSCNVGSPYFWEKHSNKFTCPLPKPDCCQVKTCVNTTSAVAGRQNARPDTDESEEVPRIRLDVPDYLCKNKTDVELSFIKEY